MRQLQVSLSVGHYFETVMKESCTDNASHFLPLHAALCHFHACLEHSTLQYRILRHPAHLLNPLTLPQFAQTSSVFLSFILPSLTYSSIDCSKKPLFQEVRSSDVKTGSSATLLPGIAGSAVPGTIRVTNCFAPSGLEAAVRNAWSTASCACSTEKSSGS